MAEGFKKAAVWLGLMSDAPYDERDDELTEAVEPVRHDRDRERERHDQVREDRALAPAEASVTALEERRPAPVPRTADLSRIVTVHPRTYNEARTIGEHFRDGVPVIMNLGEMEDVDAKRLVDFAAGLVFGLHGSIERVTAKVFLLSPEHVEVATDEPTEPARELFNQS